MLKHKHTSKLIKVCSLPGIVITVYNDSKALIQNLPLLKEHFKEIIIVDNHSQDNCEEVCLQSEVTRIVPPPQTYWTRGQCWNEGASQIHSDSILFLHADVTISQQAIDAMENCWTNQNLDYSCFKIQFLEQNFLFKAISYFSNFRSRYLRIIYGDQGLCVRRKVFKQIGGFPNEYVLEDLKINRYLRPYQFQFIETPIIPSSRKFHQLGFFHYLFLMNQVLLLNFLGVSTKKIHQIYYSRPS